MRLPLRILTAALLALLLASAGTAILATPAHTKTWIAPKANPDVDPSDDLNEFETRILIKINRARAKRGLRKIRVFESCMDHKSERWARRIKRTGKFVHRNQSKVLTDCDVMWAGENLVRGQGLTPGSAVRAWLDSPSHRKVMLKKRARWAGIGVRIDSEGRVIGVLNLGDPT